MSFDFVFCEKSISLSFEFAKYSNLGTLFSANKQHLNANASKLNDELIISWSSFSSMSKQDKVADDFVFL